MLRCILCGFCEEACPKDAIFMSDELELADFSRAALIYDIERLKRPNAFSQKPASRCHHLLQTPEVEKADDAKGEYLTRTQMIYTETRGDESQRYAATAWHTLVRKDQKLLIKLKRVDILNSDAALPSIQLFL